MAKPKSSKPQRKAPSADKSPAKPAAKTGGLSMPDTTFAVQDAAAMLGKSVGGPSTGAKKETSAFKQLKDGLNQAPMHSISKLLDKSGGQTGKKSALPFDHSRGQVGHNQTFGADAVRTGVPRRTGG